MKKLRKIAGLLLAMVLTLSMTVTAFAEEGEQPLLAASKVTSNNSLTITIDNAAKGHTYEAYQIFTGDLYTDDEGTDYLSNIVWGTGVTTAGQTALGDAAAKAKDLNNEENDSEVAQDFAEEISDYLNTAKVVTFSYSDTTNKYTANVDKAGYYFIKDKDNSLTTDGESYTRYILQVVKSTTVKAKSDTTTSQKKVKDDACLNSEGGINSTNPWQDSADYTIGSVIPFQLSATLTENLADYSEYKLVFHDDMSSGLTYASDKGVLVSLVNDGKDAESIDSNYYSVVENAADGCELEIIFSDVTEINGVVGGSTIVVEYYATLNSNAVIGSAGNENTMHVQYSNNPNSDQEGSTGNTPDDKVVVYTYKLGINKVDSANQPLKGAGFTLSKKNASGTWVKVEVNKNTGVVDDGKSTEKTNIVTELKGDNQTTFEWKGLADGFYKIEETTTPNGYNTIEPIYFTIAAKHDELSDDPQLTELTGTQVDSNGGALSTSTATFTVVTSSVIVNDKTVTTPTGTLTTNVVNEQGIVLPSTGGTGVKVLYTVGAILVLGAAILLITRRRMSMN